MPRPPRKNRLRKNKLRKKVPRCPKTHRFYYNKTCNLCPKSRPIRKGNKCVARKAIRKRTRKPLRKSIDCPVKRPFRNGSECCGTKTGKSCLPMSLKSVGCGRARPRRMGKMCCKMNGKSCVPIPVTKTHNVRGKWYKCPANRNVIVNNRCCDKNRKNCVKGIPTKMSKMVPDKTCPRGFQWKPKGGRGCCDKSGRRCVMKAIGRSGTCAPGSKWNGKKCVPFGSPAWTRQKCKSGWRWDGKKCVVIRGVRVRTQAPKKK